MQIDFSGKITHDEFLHAMKLVAGRHRKSFRVVLGIDLLIILLLVVPNLLHCPPNMSLLKSSIYPIMVLVLLFMYLLMLPHLQTRMLNHKSNFYREPVFGSLNDAELFMGNTEVKFIYSWKAFSTYNVRPDVLVIFRINPSVVVLSVSMFASKTDWEKCIALIKSKIPAGTTGLEKP